MSPVIPKSIDTKTIIVNLLKEDAQEYLSFDRLKSLLKFIHGELLKRNILDYYQIFFDVNFNSIRRTVLCNKRIFELDFDGDNIYLREPASIDVLANRYQVDETIRGIIHTFVQPAA